MEKRIDTAWDFIFDKLVHPNTNQIYDYRTSEDADGTFRHLPTPEEMKKCIPNPCGWTTGMEDSDINGGIMLDATLERIEVTSDKALTKYIDILYEGLMLNAKVSEQKGFLARTVHPSDRKSHYMNPSRDQYTHWIFGMTHYYDSEICPEERREEIRNVLVAFAEKAEKDVTAENDMSLVREDGNPALVCRMKGEKVCWHETNRLPMFYMAAYHVSGDIHWLDMYNKERDWALDKAEKIEFSMDFFKGVFALMQMQLSLRLLYNYETDESYRIRYKNLMERVSEATEPYLYASLEKLRGLSIPITVPSWRELPDEHIEFVRVSYGYEVYMHHVYLADGVDYHTLLRNATEGIITQNLCPNFKIKREQEQAFGEVVDLVDFSKAFNYFPVAFCGAYWALRQNKQ
jgi:hypothetical protein